MNFYPAYLNAAAAAAATVSLTQASDIEKFQYIAQSPYFMQNNQMLANMFKMLPKLANNMAFSNFVLKQNIASMASVPAAATTTNYNDGVDSFMHQQHNIMISNANQESSENSAKS